jgi:hypothetical protein
MRRVNRTAAGLVYAAVLCAGNASWAYAGIDDRITVGASGSTLTGTDGGAGATLNWLHTFDPNTVAGIGIDHEAISSAQWTVGSLDGSLTVGSGNTRYTLYADVRQGAGDDASRAFHYAIETAGVLTTYQQRFTVQLEDRQIDVETTHGNLPKLGFSYLWDRAVLTSVGYAYSVGGNLGTRLLTGQVQDVTARWRPLAGFAFGQAAPAILDLQPGIIPPSRILKEGYLGFSFPKTWAAGEWSVIADYLGLGDIRRGTLTLTYTHHIRHTGQ